GNGNRSSGSWWSSFPTCWSWNCPEREWGRRGRHDSGGTVRGAAPRGSLFSACCSSPVQRRSVTTADPGDGPFFVALSSGMDECRLHDRVDLEVPVHP